MKKSVNSILIIGIFILICLLGTTVHAEALSGTLNLTASTTSVKKGETFTVAINVNNIVGDNGWQSFDTSIGYDSAFELVKFEKSGNLSEMTAGSTINLMSTTSIKSSMQVGTITFKAKEDTTVTSGTVQLNNTVIGNLQGETANLTSNTLTIAIAASEEGNENPGNENPGDENPENQEPANAEQTEEQTTTDNGNDGSAKKDNNTNKKSDTATTVIPKTGAEIIAIIAIATILITGTFALIKYKNILK